MTSEELQERVTLNLMKRLEGLGSTLYSETWKAQVTPAQRLLFRLRASVLRISETGFTGWPTPAANEYEPKDLQRLEQRRKECAERTGNGNGFGLTLGQAVPMALTGWPTPNSTVVDAKPRPPITSGRKPTGPSPPVVAKHGPV